MMGRQVVARCAAAGLVAGREVAVDGSTIQAYASWEKKLPGATATDELHTREAVLRPVVGISPRSTRRCRPTRTSVSPLSLPMCRQLIRKRRSPAKAALSTMRSYQCTARPRHRLHPRRGGDARALLGRGRGDPGHGCRASRTRSASRPRRSRPTKPMATLHCSAGSSTKASPRMRR